jgi:hypothetical protein
MENDGAHIESHREALSRVVAISRLGSIDVLRRLAIVFSEIDHTVNLPVCHRLNAIEFVR